MPLILIVEDVESDAKLLQLVVESIGPKYKSIVAKNGLEAVEKLKKEKVDLVLLDVNLPGYITGKNLLFRPEVRDLPVILVSGIEEIDLKVLKIKFPSVKEYFCKPIDQERLVEEICKWTCK